MTDAPPIPQDWSDREAVEAWLQTQPRAVCVALAARAALRVLPVTVSALRHAAVEQRRFIVLPCFRAAAVPWLTAAGPSKRAEVHVRAAAARAAAASAFDRASDAAVTAAFDTAVAAAAATTAPTYAAIAVEEAIRAAGLSAPVDPATGTASLVSAAKLSADAVAADSAYVSALHLAEIPLWLIVGPWGPIRAWPGLRDHLLAADEGWEVWTDWYEARLRGDPVDVELETRRVIEPTRWEDGPAAVNAEIARIIADHAARKAARTPPEPPTGDAGERIEVLLDTPALRAAYADFEVDAEAATVRMTPLRGDVPALADADLSLDWRSRLDGLALQPRDLIEHIRDARCNVPQALLKDLARYAAEAARGPDAVRPGVLDAYGRSLIAAARIEDIVLALGEYLGGTLARIGDDHRRLMRDYHAQVTSRLHAARVELPADATPAAVADVVEVVSESLKQEPWAGLRATRDVTDLLDTQKEAFRAAAARLDMTEDAAQRQAILESIRASEVSTLASIGRLALRIRQHVGSGSPTARRVGYAAGVVALTETDFFGQAAQVVRTIMRWLGFT